MKDSGMAQIVEEEDPADFSLINNSASDDDFLMDSSSGNPGDFLAEGSHMNQPSHSVELQPKKKGNCNLRKSLAWDSAFFTNAGVLDAEELSSIIEGAETSSKQKSFLPGIEEDVSKSYDSISTFESDNLTLESLEADLFCDVRASIQRTSRPSAQGKCSGTKLLGQAETANGSSTIQKKAVEISAGNSVKPKLATRKLNPSVQRPSRTLKPGIISKQIAKPPVSGKESKAVLLRPPEAVAKPSSIGAAATKKTSISASRAKIESNPSGISKGKVAPFSKVSYQADSSKTVPKALASSKLLSGSSVSGRGATTRSSRSSCDSSSSVSSETIRKSPSDINQRKTDKNVTLAPGSKIRGPSRITVKSKSRSADCHLSDYLKSTSQPSSISPTSSVSEWSTESSSSTATINQYTGLLNQSKKQPSSECDVSFSRPSSAKPSGLRMPSASIGFFDRGKAAAKTPSGVSQPQSRSAFPSSLPRSGALNNTSSGTPGKSKAVVKPDSRKTVSNLKPVCLSDHSAGLPKTLNADNVDRVFDITSKVSEIDLYDSASKVCGEIVNEGKRAADFSSEAVEDISLVPAKKEESPEAKLHSSTIQATIAVKDLGNAMHVSDCVVLTEIPFYKKDQINGNEYSDIENVNTVSETSSKVLILDPALEENDELLNEGKQSADSSLNATRDINIVATQKEAILDVANSMHIADKTSSKVMIPGLVLEENDKLLNEGKQAATRDMSLVAAKKEASPDVKLQSLTNPATIAAEDVGNSMHMSNCIKDLTESPLCKRGQSTREEESDIENVDTVSETSSKVSESVLLDPALEGSLEVLDGGKHPVGSTSEATKDVNLVEAKKEASPEVNLHSSTNHAGIAVQDMSNATHVSYCIEDPTESPFSPKGGSNRKEHSDVENVDTISETSSEVLDCILLDLAFEEILELLYEGKILDLACEEIQELLYDARNDAESCSDSTNNINLVEAEKEASPEVNLHSSTNHAAITVQYMSNATNGTGCIEDPAESPFSPEVGSNRNEQSDVDIVSEISSNVSESDLRDLAFEEICEVLYEGRILDLAFEEVQELLYEGRNDDDSCSEAAKDIYLVTDKKEATPEVKSHSSTNQTTLDIEDLCDPMHLSDCVTDLILVEATNDEMDMRRESNGKEESTHNVLVNEDINLVSIKKEASPEVKSHSSTNHATIAVKDESNAVPITGCIGDLTKIPSSEEGQSNRTKQHSDVNDVFSSQGVDENDSLEISSVNGALEAEQNSHPNNMEMASESSGNFQSQSLLVDQYNSSFILTCPKELCTEEEPVQSVSIIPGSLSLLSPEVSPETRTPFTIKNSVADLIKAYNKSAEPAIRSLEKGQKENC